MSKKLITHKVSPEITYNSRHRVTFLTAALEEPSLSALYTHTRLLAPLESFRFFFTNLVFVWRQGVHLQPLITKEED